MKTPHPINRRCVLKSLATAPLILPNMATAANDRINIGVFGLGDRGPAHIRTFLGMPETRIVAVCDPYKSKCEHWQNQVNKRYQDTACTAHQDYREVIARDDIDAIVVASPENWHALHGVAAVKAGKDVYGEKGLTLTVAEGQELCSAVRRHQRVFQVGTQQRSMGQFRKACEMVRNGVLGELKEVRVGVPGGRALATATPKPPPPDIDYDLWLGPAPHTPYNDIKCTFNWYFMSDYCAGWIQSWGIHHMDILHWGTPSFFTGKITVEGTADFPEDGEADTSINWKTKITNSDGLVASYCNNREPGHSQGVRFIGEKGWVHVNRRGITAEPASLLNVPIPANGDRLQVSTHHHVDFLKAIRTRRDPVAPVEDGHRSNVITLVADIATRLRRPLTWDWSSETFVDDLAANRMLFRTYRSPWTL